MSVPPDQIESSLVQAHLLITRKQYGEARYLLERIIETDPSCREAQQMLDSVAQKQAGAVRRNREGSLYDELYAATSIPPWFPFSVVILGLFLTLTGVWLCVLRVRQYTTTGHNGYFDLQDPRSPRLISTPIYALLGFYAVIISIGLVILVVTYRMFADLYWAWRKTGTHQ